MKIKARFLALMAAVVMGVNSAFAEALISTTDLNDNLTQIKTDLGSWVTSALPIILTIAGGFLIFWLAKFAWGLFKSFANKSK